MPGANLKLATVLSVLGAIALSMAPVEAQTARKKPVNRSVATSGQYVYPPPSARAYYRGSAYTGGGINFNDGRMGANYNPNQ